MKKITLTLKQRDLPFSQCPRFAELEPERIACNDVHLPWESHCRKGVQLFVIGNEYGALCAVWSDNLQDALDEATDLGWLDSFLIDEADQASATEDEREEWAHLGNAGEPADLDHCGPGEVEFDKARDVELLCAFAEARGAQQTTLDR